jgi:hypothetical protein
MMSSEFALKNIPIRVNSIAPGVYAYAAISLCAIVSYFDTFLSSEMTFDSIDTPEAVARVAQSIHPVPAGRAGS